MSSVLKIHGTNKQNIFIYIYDCYKRMNDAFKNVELVHFKDTIVDCFMKHFALYSEKPNVYDETIGSYFVTKTQDVSNIQVFTSL